MRILTRISAYWFKYIITTPNQLTAAAIVISYWVPAEKVNPGVFIAIFLVRLLLSYRACT
jgi:amino acid transporter